MATSFFHFKFSLLNSRPQTPNTMTAGILWVLTAATLLGFYAFPSKFAKGYKLENLWGLFWVFAMFIVPIASGFLLVEGLADTYAQVPSSVLISILALSLLWGIGNLLWGISISTIGMALGFSLLIGVGTLVGSVLPFLMGDLSSMATKGGMTILAGIFVIMLGIIANGKAGLLREKFENEQSDTDTGSAKNMKKGIILCVIGGICAAGFNLSYHVADHIGAIGSISQEQFNNPPWIARIAVMLPSFIGSGIATVIYFSVQLSKNNSWGHFKAKGSGKNLFLILAMALVYCASLIIYGLGAYQLGEWGTSVGFAIFQTGCIMVANLIGIFSGEWKSAGAQSKKWMYLGLGIMTLGIIVVAYGNSLQA